MFLFIITGFRIKNPDDCFWFFGHGFYLNPESIEFLISTRFGQTNVPYNDIIPQESNIEGTVMVVIFIILQFLIVKK